MSVDLEEKLEIHLSELYDAIVKEVSREFEKIIENYQSEGLYALRLYHSGYYYGYLNISFSTNKGLDYATQQHDKYSLLEPEQCRSTLKWSACDSPYHDYGEEVDVLHDYLMPIQLVIDSISVTPDSDSLVYTCMERVRETVVKALHEVSKKQLVSDWLNRKGNVMYLDAGDIDLNDVLLDVEKICGKEKRELLSKEFEIAEENAHLEMELHQKENEKESKSIDLSSNDFLELINDFNPVISFEKGVFYIEGNEPALLKECEREENRFDIMELLKPSQHFDEIDRHYGYFIGPQFKKGDLIPEVGLAFVEKLIHSLKQSHSGCSFIVELYADRMGRSLFCFYEGDPKSTSEYYNIMKHHAEVDPEHAGVVYCFHISQEGNVTEI